MTLTEKWSDGITTFHGLHIRGFPNCFVMSVAQSGLTVNFPYSLNEQAKHIAYITERALAKGMTSFETSEESEAGWVETVVSLSNRSVEFSMNCTPGYYNNEGMPSEKSRQNGFFMGGPTEFGDILKAWRADGKMVGLEIE